MKKPHAFNVNLETNAFSLEQTTSTDFDPLYEVASNSLVWEQHPEKDRWKRPVFSAFFQGAMENDLGCFTIRDKSAGIVIGSTRFYSHDVAGEAVRLGYTFLCPKYWGSGANQEMKQVLLEHAFTIVEDVYFDIGKENFRSRKQRPAKFLLFHQRHGRQKRQVSHLFCKLFVSRLQTTGRQSLQLTL